MVQAGREDTAWRGCPGRQSSSEHSLTAKLSYDYLNQVKPELLAAGDPRLQGLARVQVNPTVLLKSLCPCPKSEGRPHPCAREIVLQAICQYKKGKNKFDGPLCFKMPDLKTRALNPEPKPSAFQPVSRNGVTQSFVPRPGPLSRSCAQGNPAL
ncbi:nuclear envelope pore membrane protein POM 121 [Fukomys damarensis]|uniref:POM121-like protein 12 n=1 Tax=Fukomys damarensis TaxID=885580 RepID=A0A091DTR3_FUKDA|nr:nuclear envelope pore membrane protein POM 121 [Fukomys damarensis]KFO35539.1 POM121-like protein 12 [Fukomys damarensis]